MGFLGSTTTPDITLICNFWVLYSTRTDNQQQSRELFSFLGFLNCWWVLQSKNESVLIWGTRERQNSQTCFIRKNQKIKSLFTCNGILHSMLITLTKLYSLQDDNTSRIKHYVHCTFLLCEVFPACIIVADENLPCVNNLSCQWNCCRLQFSDWSWTCNDRSRQRGDCSHGAATGRRNSSTTAS